MYPFSVGLGGPSSAAYQIHGFPVPQGLSFWSGGAGNGVVRAGAVKMTSYHCRQQRESFGRRRSGRSFLPAGGGGVHSLVKISSFSGKKSLFPSCVLRKFLLYCVHTSKELSDGKFTSTGIIWYDVLGNSQCLTTLGLRSKPGARAAGSAEGGPAVRKGRPDGRAQRENL